MKLTVRGLLNLKWIPIMNIIDSTDNLPNVNPNDTVQGSDTPQGSSKYIRIHFTNNSAALCNAWDDPLYITTAFPTFISYGCGGHLEKRPIKVSLEAYRNGLEAPLAEGTTL